jgi:predicted GIY-YIG superfamily endonuclease
MLIKSSGCYILFFLNDPLGRIYTGRTSNYEKRFQKHYSDLQNNKHHNYKLQEWYNLTHEPPSFIKIEGSFNTKRSEQINQNKIIRSKQWNISKFADNPKFKKKKRKKKVLF